MRFNKYIVYILAFIIVFAMINTPATKAGNGTKNTLLKTSQQDPEVFKVLNYNILEGGRNKEEIMQVIKHENAPIMTLVETGAWSSKDGSFDEALAEINAMFPDEKPYQGYTFKPDSVTDGQAIFSRYPIVAAESLPTVKLDDGTDYFLNHELLHVTIDVDGTKIHIFTIHLTCCDGGLPSRLLEIEGMINYFDTLGDVPIMFTGDFNSGSPEDRKFDGISNLGDEPIDMLVNSSNPKASVIHQFTDVYRTLNPTLPGYTYIDNYYKSRLDYIFVNQHLTDTMVNSTVINNYEAALIGSDHFPMKAFFNMDWQNVDLRPPVPVSNVNIDVSTTKATLTWDENTEQDLWKYSIYRNDCLIIDLLAGTNSFVDDYEYSEGTVYYYSISATDLSKNEGAGSLPIFINSSYGVLTVPEAPVLTVDSPSTKTVSLNWTVSDNGGTPIHEYKIYRSNAEDGVFGYYDTTTDTTYIDIIGRSGITTYYKVVAVNSIGDSDFSNIAGVKVKLKTNINNLHTHKSNNNFVQGINSISLGTECPAPISIITELPQTEITNSTTSTVVTISDSTTQASPVNIFTFVVFLAVFSLILNRRNK